MEFNATFLATIISFVLFVILMNKILYAPILNIMEQRKSFIDGNYTVAKNNEVKIEKLVQKKEEKLLENQELFKTPIVRNGKKATLGYCPEIWKEWEKE